MRVNRNLVKELGIFLPINWWVNWAGNRKTITSQEYTPEEKAWDSLLTSTCAWPHYMQSSAWGESKARSQWPVSRFVVGNQGNILPIQVFSRTVPGLGRLHYAPEVAGISEVNISALTEQIRRQYSKGMVFKMELYEPFSESLLDTFLSSGWVIGNSVQHRNTVIVDLAGDEEALFGRMKKRARYEVRVAQRNGVRIEKFDATQEKLSLLASLMDITAKRSGAFFRKTTYTDKYWNSFTKTGQGKLYLAWHDMDLLAGAFVISYSENAWYKDGGSVRQKSNLMGPRLLQWEIMKDLQAHGIKKYDLSGIPSEEELEKSSMKGLHTFKTGFTSETTRFMPALELPLGKRYQIWPKTEPQFLRLYSGFRKDFWY